jgi:hypothetical protein
MITLLDREGKLVELFVELTVITSVALRLMMLGFGDVIM